ncbi:hypothetical protein [Planococcus sp. CAU13]|uniref:hypothetical protein n=1 Tax=Planococcus sp. CAU13 TaxID=1541197 RepID=UPI00052FF079|nr:hypothetical protein [Planococcus sp. CAU13]
MGKMKWIPILVLLFCAACSSNNVEEAENVRLEYWAKEGSEEMPVEEYADETNGLAVFRDVVNQAEELEKEAVIVTRPLLTLEFMMKSEENRKYHLWVTEAGEGYLQSLHPHKSVTLRMDLDSAEELKDFIAAKEDVEVLKGDIEFEQLGQNN